MRIVAYILFAVGVMIAVSGGAKLPPTVIRFSIAEFEAKLDDGSLNPTEMQDAQLDQNRLVFRSPATGADPDERPYNTVSLEEASEQQRAALMQRLEGASVEFAVSEAVHVPAFPNTLPLFAVGIVIGLVGLLLWRWDDHNMKMDLAHGPKTDGSDPLKLLANLIKPAQELELEIDKLSKTQIEQRVDELLEKYVLPFAEHRHKVTTRLGMSLGAEILVTAAVGERLLNRTWSAAGDGHLPEARNSYPEAVRAFEEAQRLAEEAVLS